MSKILEKKERRLGEKLLLKSDRCSGPKCAMVRRAYPPGAHGKAKRRASSEFGTMLRDKQIVRFLYDLDDNKIERYSKEASLKQGVFNSNFVDFLERRLDNTVFRLGLAASRRSAKQFVGHGHISVNGRTINIPSYRVKKGDSISIKDLSSSKEIFANLELRLKKYEAPKWLELDKAKKIGKVIGNPDQDDAGLVVELTKIKEFYSR